MQMQPNLNSNPSRYDLKFSETFYILLCKNNFRMAFKKKSMCHIMYTALTDIFLEVPT